MRLLYTTRDGRLGWTEDLIGDKIPPYAILSHTWKEGQEVTFADLQDLDNAVDVETQSKEGYRKIRFCAQQAKRDGLDYFWVDTCCIDKANNTELSRAINSMFRWYQNAKRCYVFLSDVANDTSDIDSKSALKQSRWFKRGWTLQELLAPRSVEFFSKEGERLGDKESLQHLIHEVTGCGKTILSSTIIEHLLQHCYDDTSVVTAYFYFDFNDTQKQDPELMLRSLLCQLLQRSVVIPKGVDALFSSCENGQRKPSSHALLQVIKEAAQEFTHVYVVLDALDECAQRSELMDMLETVAEWQLDNLHLLMTSRKERDIERSLEGYIKEQDAVCLQRDVVDQDIQRYVQQRLHDDKSLAKWNKDAAVRQEIEVALMRRACGMFRWAVCQLDTLGKCCNRAMLRKSLATLPRTLDQTYDRILTAISEEYAEYAMRILQWLTFSARPLSVEEIAEVVAIDVARDPAFDGDEVLEDPLEVLDICSSLVTITTNKADRRLGSAQRIVALAHYSVQEYLVSDRIRRGSAKQYSMQEAACQSAITRGSLKYLMQLQQPLEREILQIFALARYSAEFWSSHLRKTGDEMEQVSQLTMGLLAREEPAYLNWLRLHDPDRPWEELNLERSADSIPMPLYYAALLGFGTVTRLLLDKDADVNAQGGEYGNALQAASEGGHEQIVKMLLDKGAEVNAQGGDYGNALQAASARGHEQVVKTLLNAGAEVNAQGGDYGNALQAASARGHEQVVKTLLNAGAH
ncbi:hypothetical protein AA0119_g11495 [Alternaria tenuissima]|uniref:Heterokaryon incompatibility domain-containing protein n=1 Tax=Alternaria tenuissima TaxID=119927 RepID=A0AB37W4L2_9PLEO|nr:hypothetical protein AA0115_g11989 [Alternaria tenuissima]RYN89320.1 hypothetical protein AA0119_g11495 [Alternaria tenuissima]RYO05957.1 hypothetical protein AA0121_g12261 [Alternaria tenuissima]